MRAAALLAMCLFAAPFSVAPVHAAQITRMDDGPTGSGWRFANVSAERAGECRIGGASIGCSPIAADPIKPLIKYGQVLGTAVNSQDTNLLKATFSSDEAFDQIWIDTRDAHDQANSSWVMELEGATAELLERQKNDARIGWLVQLEKAVHSVSVTFSTRVADGFSFNGKVCRR